MATLSPGVRSDRDSEVQVKYALMRYVSAYRSATYILDAREKSCLCKSLFVEPFTGLGPLASSLSAAMSRVPQKKWGPVRSLLCLAPLLVAAPFYAYKTFYGMLHY